MRSFINEIDEPVVERDILDLEKKIHRFHNGEVDEERFRSLRLARGVYGQRQPGVQMVRIKLPYGRMTREQLLRIADVSDEYATGDLHLTTRQDIQIHYVNLDRTPELWAQLEQDKVTLREACGNTVRNVTASDKAGIDPNEPFDVTPYADAFFRYFLRNPICQEMGRKFKVAFSSSEKDDGMTFMHDLGFIPKLQDGARGFKVMIGGGLGAQFFHAYTATEFMPEEEIIPFAEAVLRVFDRHGERSKRMKARFKFLIKEYGLEEVLRLVEEERNGLAQQHIAIDRAAVPAAEPPQVIDYPQVEVDEDAFAQWQATNVFEQKQEGFWGVYLKITLGNISTRQARQLAAIAEKYAADDLRITINQGLLLKFVRPEALRPLYAELKAIGLADAGFDRLADITACPGTDTCNLGISSSTGIAVELEKLVEKEYADLIHDDRLLIKVSGCMNSCAQHGIANIGLQGSSMKSGGYVVPAMMMLLGGGIGHDGTGYMADKLTKLPSKRVPQALRLILDEYREHKLEGEYFNDFYRRLGKDHFYQLIKPLTDTKEVAPDEFIDWGHNETYVKEVGVGECAGAVVDLVATLIYEAEEKLGWARDAFNEEQYSDAVYHAYNAQVVGAKALLTADEQKTNRQIGILNDFQAFYGETGAFTHGADFKEHVLRIKEHPAEEAFARQYIADAAQFLQEAKAYREEQLSTENLESEHANA